MNEYKRSLIDGLIREAKARGDSAEKTYISLKGTELGTRKQEFLKEWRGVTGAAPKATPEKYIPRKYLKPEDLVARERKQFQKDKFSALFQVGFSSDPEKRVSRKGAVRLSYKTLPASIEDAEARALEILRDRYAEAKELYKKRTANWPVWVKLQRIDRRDLRMAQKGKTTRENRTPAGGNKKKRTSRKRHSV